MNARERWRTSKRPFKWRGRRLTSRLKTIQISQRLNNLGNKLKSRHEHTGKMEDLEEAIRVARQAVDVTPEGHPDLAAMLNNLGNKLGRRYERTGKMEGLEEAIRVSDGTGLAWIGGGL